LSIPRVYLTGGVAVESGGQLIGEAQFPGRQGRVAFAFLTAHRGRPVSRAELADVLWEDQPPDEAEAALSAILSKLRVVLKKAGWGAAPATIDVRTTALGICFPADTWVDVEAATNAIDEAEGALRSGRPGTAWGLANLVVSIARRPFLAGHEGAWIERRRGLQRTLLRRGLECLASASEAGGEVDLAVQYLAEVLELAPFRETTYRQLMRLHAAAGNRAEALQLYARCRELFRDELGAGPSPQTEAVYLGILRAETA
jgi:DNA-binding SARP family transcriptional activator